MLIPFTSASFTNLSGLAVADGAEVEVRLELNGALAALFDDRAGTTPLTNPFNADSQGRFEFYVAGRIDGYSIQVTKGAQTHTLRHQLTGSAAATLFDNAGTDLLAESVQDAIVEIASSLSGISTNTADLLSVFNWFTDTEIADVRARTALVDVTASLNTAFAYGSNNNVGLYMPPGKYKVTDTLWATPAGSTFQSCHIRGAGGGFAEGQAQTEIHSTVTTKPAINIQKARGVYIGHLLLQGPGKRSATDISIGDMLHNAAWVTGGHRDSRYSPMCGICIDAGVGSTPPDGGYPGITYRNVGGGTAAVVFDNLVIRQFVVGIMHNPEQNATQGDQVLINNPQIHDTKVSIATGQAQGRCITVVGGNLSFCRTAFDGQEYGQQQGNGPLFLGTQFGPGFEMFSSSVAFNPTVLIGCRAESVHRVGEGGRGSVVGAYPIYLNGCDIKVLNHEAHGVRGCPVVLETEGHVMWHGGSLGDDTSAGAYFFNITGNSTLMESGSVGRMVDRFRPYIGGRLDFSNPVELHSCRIYDGTNYLFVGDDSRRFSVSGRYTAHWSEKLVHDRNTLYRYVHGTENVYRTIGTQSAESWSDTQLTFQNTDAAGGLMVGDIVAWQFNLLGKSLSQLRMPALRITAISAPTVTCELLFKRSYYDETHTPGTTYVIVHEWAPAQALTGNTNSNNQLTSVSPTTILQNGDWITAASGIPANTRVLSGGGTATITLSRNATDTASGKTLYWGRLHTVDTTPAF